MEALYEVARQLRLRDIGGMVIVDFIDMMYDENRRKLYHEMTRELGKDSAKTVVYPLTQLGLMQITRQRIRQNIMAVITEDCTHCRGTGKVYSRSVVLNSLERWLRNYKTTSSAFSIHLLVHPDLGAILTSGDFSLLQKLMLKYFIRIKLHYSTDLPFNEFQFVPIDQE
jgi:ribonuclease G